MTDEGPPRGRHPGGEPVLRPTPAHGGPRLSLATILQLAGLVALLVFLLGFVLLVVSIVSLLGAPTQLAGGLGDRMAGVGTVAGRVLADAERAVRDTADPSHPPSGLTYDLELSELLVIHKGSPLPGGETYVLTLADIRRRDGADSPNTAAYAVVKAELRKPRETRVFGQLLRSDSDAHEYVLYKGELFRIGRALYRVNWISLEESTMAIGRLRRPDDATGVIKFGYD